MASWGIGGQNGRNAPGSGGVVQTPPTNPGNGSGGAGILGLPTSLAGARAELADVTTGRITLGVINIALVSVIAFYFWTRSVQGG